MKSLDIAWAAIDAIETEDDSDLTLYDCVHNPDLAVYAVSLVVNAKDFPPFVIDKEGFKKGNKVFRTDVTTAKRMLTMRKELEKYRANESNPEYAPFWDDMLEINEAYFLKFFADLYDLDPDLMDGVNRLRKEEAERQAEANRKRSEAAKARAEAAKREKEAAEAAE